MTGFRWCNPKSTVWKGSKLSEILRYADVMLDERRHEVARAGVSVELTPREFELLAFFLVNPQRVLSKQQILDNVWPQDFRGSAEIVERYVRYLRRKLHALGPPLIRTVRQSGYVLDVQE